MAQLEVPAAYALPSEFGFPRRMQKARVRVDRGQGEGNDDRSPKLIGRPA